MGLCHIGLAIWTALSQHSRRTRCHHTLEEANAVLCHWSPVTGNDLGIAGLALETANSLHSAQYAMPASITLAEACWQQACFIRSLQDVAVCC